MTKAVVIRPGALGDVLETRGAVAFLKRIFPAAETTVIAPGARGRFLCRPGLADAFFDWERGELSWLFTSVEEKPPRELEAAFASAVLVLAYLDPRHKTADLLEQRLRVLAPGAGIVVAAPSPPADVDVPIARWLIRAILPHAIKNLGKDKATALADEAFAAKIVIPNAASAHGHNIAKRRVVMHPGSGSAKKNWGVANFAALGERLLGCSHAGGDPRLGELVVTSGEADGDLGFALVRELPGARHVHMPDLETLAELLAGACLYVGNDSGVSHLAGMVADSSGRAPDLAVLFGPSNSRVWAPPGALVLEAGPDMRGVTPDKAFTRIAAFMRGC